MKDQKIIALGLLIIMSFLSSLGYSAEPDSSWVKDEILQQLAEIRKEIKSLKSDVAMLDGKLASLQIKGEQVAAEPVEIKFNPDQVLGRQNAKIAIIEFSDYQCPYCSRHTNTVLPDIKQKFIDTGKVKYGLYDYPLSFHAQAKSASVVARCAGQQSKYWEAHDILFKNSNVLNPSLYKKIVTDLGLNETLFEKCINDPAIDKAIASNVDDGNRLGVSGTPKFFVGKIKDNVMTNVTVIDGAQPFEAFSAAITRLEK